jgi:hypothetical protein
VFADGAVVASKESESQALAGSKRGSSRGRGRGDKLRGRGGKILHQAPARLSKTPQADKWNSDAPEKENDPLSPLAVCLSMSAPTASTSLSTASDAIHNPPHLLDSVRRVLWISQDPLKLIVQGAQNKNLITSKRSRERSQKDQPFCKSIAHPQVILLLIRCLTTFY